MSSFSPTSLGNRPTKTENPATSFSRLGRDLLRDDFFFAFFEEDEEETDYNIDPYEEYMLKRRYGDDWRKYIAYEEDVDFGDFFDEDDFDEGLDGDDSEDGLPF